ncbi:DUF6496 domain-containing protein [Fulvimonas soli]|jgi:hypothetical protein|uniref:Ku family containing domain-containing protein n=1 Tax=Fulvimonas soli TaxID=155197 RepID=A0A316I2X5_9GAMM|nr:DUF6496 domain-containing protein [Fulvimonas soli]PWK86703.1 hypothetical protein C7456_10794 [Fulvimonas soli]TNY25759.1 ku family containing domain-containing protein [Fulvimonas soli]
MPEKRTRQAAARDRREGKSPSTRAGEFVREEIEHVRHGKHGARSARQAIAIGLSKARRAGVEVPAKKTASAAARKRAARDEQAGEHPHKPAATRSRATSRALEKEGRAAASKRALAGHARKSAARRGAAARSAAAKKAVRTKGAAGRSAAAKKAARTRARRAHAR